MLIRHGRWQGRRVPRYNAGESELLDVLSIQQRVVSAQRSLSSVKRLLLEQRVNLNLALGGDWRN